PSPRPLPRAAAPIAASCVWAAPSFSRARIRPNSRARIERWAITIEMMGWSLPDSADAYLKLLKVVARPGLGGHMDICNIINSQERYYRNAEIINDVFRKLGRWVCSCHAKDLHGKNVHLAETVPGRGGIDYRAYLANITELPFEAPLMLEHLSNPAEYEEGK